MVEGASASIDRALRRPAALVSPLAADFARKLAFVASSGWAALFAECTDGAENPRLAVMPTTKELFVFLEYRTGTHHVTVKTTDRPGDPFADVRSQLTLDIGGDAVVYVFSNARVYASGSAKVYIFGNAHVFAWGNAEIFFLGEGRLEIGGHAHATTSKSVLTIATDWSCVNAAGQTFAYGDARIETDAETKVNRHGYATVTRGDVVEGPSSPYRGGYFVRR